MTEKGIRSAIFSRQTSFYYIVISRGHLQDLPGICMLRKAKKIKAACEDHKRLN